MALSGTVAFDWQLNRIIILLTQGDMHFGKCALTFTVEVSFRPCFFKIRKSCFFFSWCHPDSGLNSTSFSSFYYVSCASSFSSFLLFLLPFLFLHIFSSFSLVPPLHNLILMRTPMIKAYPQGKSSFFFCWHLYIFLSLFHPLTSFSFFQIPCSLIPIHT